MFRRLVQMEDSDRSDDNSDEEGDGGGGSGAESGSVHSAEAQDSTGAADSEGEFYDIDLAAAHSYMDAGLVSVKGRSVLEAGWVGRVPVLPHHGCVFPGETVPMLLTDAGDARLLSEAIQRDRVFGLLCPDESGRMASEYGVLCEVYEASMSEGANNNSITFKARANHRFKTIHSKQDIPVFPVEAYNRLQFVLVRVLPEAPCCDTLRSASLHSLDSRKGSRHTPQRESERRLRGLEAALTPWPLLVHDMFDYQRMRNMLEEHFKTMQMDKLPADPVSLSFWVASNLALSPKDRFALFVVDNALLRLHMECRFLKKKTVLCCVGCLTEIARHDFIFPMSSEGVHSNYVNLGGFVHDLLTVRQTTNIKLNGSPSAEYSWFPGYAWTIATCANCTSHIGWRFVARTRSLRPQHFYGLCRNYLRPCTRSRRRQASVDARDSMDSRPDHDDFPQSI